MLKWTVILAGGLLAGAALADEAKIRRVVEDKLGVRVDGVGPAPLPGLFEVRFRSREGVRVIYSDADATRLVVGEIYDAKSDVNLTEERVRKLSAIDFRKLPLDLAVKVRRGNGRRTLAMFSDPYCPACRSFEKTLAGVGDITVYIFLYPVIRPEHADHSRAVWCSSDRARAWLDLAASDSPRVPAAAPDCSTPVERTLALGRGLGVNSTPTLFFANGERVSGGLSAERLTLLLDEVAGAQAKPNAK